MRLKEDRTSQILELLAKDGRAEVTQLAQALGVSQVTMRKDLAAMEETGIIKREHGFAVLASTDDINGRIAYHYEAKQKIAARAALLVQDGETIMIESGSCCAMLADTLTQTKSGLTVITNSAFIANYIRKKADFQVVLLGGIYQQDSEALVGPMVRQCAENFWVDKFFVGVDGYSKQTGFTNCDQMRAQAVRDMARQADRVIVLTESEKFSRRGTVPLNLKDRVKFVITDSSITDEMCACLKESEIEVIKV